MDNKKEYLEKQEKKNQTIKKLYTLPAVERAAFIREHRDAFLHDGAYLQTYPNTSLYDAVTAVGNVIYSWSNNGTNWVYF